MTGTDHPRASLFARTVTRREMLLTTGALAGFALVGCGSTASPATSAAPPATGTFIGSVAMPAGALIAVHVGAAGDARGLLYGPAPTKPDGSVGNPDELTAEWFDGVVLTGDKLSGSSAGGYRLTGALAADGVRGSVAGPDGASQEFQANPATGTAGLYDVTINPADGTLTGSSATGARVTSAPLTSPTDPLRVTELVLTITPAGGAPTEFRIPFFRGNSDAQLGLIVSQTGDVRGGPRKGKATGGSGSGFTCPLID